MEEYEQRISKLELEMESKCEENSVRQIVKEELAQAPSRSKEDQINGNSIGKSVENPNLVTSFMSEINQRKARENNFVIYGVEEGKEQLKA